jgi:hypothetical protein
LDSSAVAPAFYWLGVTGFGGGGIELSYPTEASSVSEGKSRKAADGDGAFGVLW